MTWKSFFGFFFFPIGPKGELAFASYEFVEQNRKEENMKHVPSCSPQDEGAGCVCSTTS